jgi:hypothetical protein
MSLISPSSILRKKKSQWCHRQNLNEHSRRCRNGKQTRHADVQMVAPDWYIPNKCGLLFGTVFDLKNNQIINLLQSVGFWRWCMILRITGFLDLHVVRNSKWLENKRFGNWICFCLHPRGGRHLLCWVRKKKLTSIIWQSMSCNKVGKPEWKRPLGRPRRRWVDNIRMNLGQIRWGDVDWIGLALDRNRWRAVVNSVLSLGVPWNAGKLSSGLTSSGLSTRVVLSSIELVSYIILRLVGCILLRYN